MLLGVSSPADAIPVSLDTGFDWDGGASLRFAVKPSEAIRQPNQPRYLRLGLIGRYAAHERLAGLSFAPVPAFKSAAHMPITIIWPRRSSLS